MATRTYNVEAQLFVKSVPNEDPSLVCPYAAWINKCSRPVKSLHVLGRHSSPACADEGHEESARLKVAQDFVEEMMDLYGNVAERKSES